MLVRDVGTICSTGGWTGALLDACDIVIFAARVSQQDRRFQTGI
jgi:hypothetical protein